MSKGAYPSEAIPRRTRIFEASREGISFTVAASEYDIQRMPVTLRQVLDLTAKEMDARILSARETNDGDIREVRFEATVEGRAMSGRMVVAGRRVYSATADGRTGLLAGKIVPAFLDSLKISPAILAEAREVHVCAPVPCVPYEGPGYSIAFPRVPKEIPHDGIRSFGAFNPPVLALVDVYPEGSITKGAGGQLAALRDGAVRKWSGTVDRRASCGPGCEDIELVNARKLDQTGTVWQRVVLTGGAAYVATLFAPSQLPRTEAQAFLASFVVHGR